MRFSIRRRGAAVLLPLLATLSSGVAQAEPNIVPVEVSQKGSDLANTLFVDVTVCDARKQCRTVPNVVVDTGSAGLILSREALHGLELDAVTTSDDRPLHELSGFGSGYMWATVHWARVRIGGIETTEAIPIELFDRPSPGERLPAGYGRDMRDARRTGNGILGISAERYSEGGYAVVAGPGDEPADSGWHPVKVEESRQVANPIIHFPEPYNTGSVISLPEVDASKGQKTVQGWLGFGLGEPTAMLFAKGRPVITHELDASGRLPFRLGERPIDVKLDSGASVLYLDLDFLGLPRHKDQTNFYDPAALTRVDLSVMSGGHEIKLARTLQIGAADNMDKIEQGYAVLPMLAMWQGGDVALLGDPERSMFGLPFFYGRSVATGLEGAVNPFAPPVAATETLPEEGQALVTHSPNGFVAFTD